MSNQIYIPPINFNDFDVHTGSTTSINAIEPLEYNKLNSNLSIKVATENNYGVMTTGTQNIRGIKNFVDSISVPSAEVNNVSLTSGTITTSPTNDTDITNKKYVDATASATAQELKNLIGDTNEKAIVLTGFQRWYYGTIQYNFNAYVSKYKNKYILKFGIGEYIKSTTSTYESDTIFLSFEGLKGGEFEDLYSYMPNSFTLKAKQKKESKYYNIEAEFEKGTLTYNEITYQGFRMLTKAIGNGFNNLEVKYIDCYFNNSDLSNINKINCTEQDCSTLNVSDNYINKVSVSIMVRTRGSAGTFDKDLTIYKTILNGKTSIIFNKNLDFNSYSNTTDASISKNSIILNMSNLSDIFSNLPYEFELTGETSTYGGTKNIATRTLKFVKSPADPYKYDLQYDQSFPFNIFKLKDTIKNTDTIISTSETQKINTLTIDKGYLYNTPTEENNLVNKSYVDSLVSTKVSESATELSDVFNGVISESISSISSVALTTGTISTTPSAANDIANKKYVDYSITDFETITNNKINSEIGEALSNLSTVNLTTGTISTAPTNDTDIANKKFVLDSVNGGNGNVIRYNKDSYEVLDSDNVAFDLLKFNCFVQIDNDLKTSTISSSSILSDEILAKTKLESENLISNTSTLTTLNSGNITNSGKIDSFEISANASVLANVSVNDTITLSDSILSVLSCTANIENYQGDVLTTCIVNIFRIKLNNKYYIRLSFNFEPFTTVEKTFPTYYIKYLDIPKSGTSQIKTINYFYKKGESYGGGNLNVGRCSMDFYNGITAFGVNKYVVQLGITTTGDTSASIPNDYIIYSIPDITLIYSV